MAAIALPIQTAEHIQRCSEMTVWIYEHRFLAVDYATHLIDQDCFQGCGYVWHRLSRGVSLFINRVSI